MQNAKEPNANLVAMLLANLTKSDQLKRILALNRAVPNGLSSSKNAMDQLMDCFVKGAEGRWNAKADFDYLAYVFADVAKVGAKRGLAGLDIVLGQCTESFVLGCSSPKDASTLSRRSRTTVSYQLRNWLSSLSTRVMCDGKASRRLSSEPTILQRYRLPI